MEMTLNYSGAFCELGYDELECVNGGGAGKAFAYILVGGICIVYAPVVGVAAGAGYGIFLVGSGLYGIACGMDNY